eukprot:TRINITY_DN15807_c0_g1_i1.p1 TRINITY_DN15807_c0_g1~~TRINITY_DN15807_c0_g1_i1.p1  ORF type:complete len:334 (+),score=39.14 TRINITY_DN15807_c0_g1_i1:68-1069(+)
MRRCCPTLCKGATLVNAEGRRQLWFAEVGEAVSTWRVAKEIEKGCGKVGMMEVLDDERVNGVVGEGCYVGAVWYIGVGCEDFKTAYVVAQEWVETGNAVTEGIILALLKSAVMKPGRPEYVNLTFALLTSETVLSPDFCSAATSITISAKDARSATVVAVFRTTHSLAPPVPTDGVYDRVAESLAQPEELQWYQQFLASRGVRMTPRIARKLLISAGRTTCPSQVTRIFESAVLSISPIPEELDYITAFAAYARCHSIGGMTSVLDHIDSHHEVYSPLLVHELCKPLRNFPDNNEATTKLFQRIKKRAAAAVDPANMRPLEEKLKCWVEGVDW